MSCQNVNIKNVMPPEEHEEYEIRGCIFKVCKDRHPITFRAILVATTTALLFVLVVGLYFAKKSADQHPIKSV